MPFTATPPPPRPPARVAHDHRSPLAPDGARPSGRARFDGLLQQLATLHPALAGVPLAEGSPFLCGRQLVSLSDGGALAPGRVVVHVDLDDLVGARPPADLHVRLLTANHDGCLQGRGYSLSPDTGHIVYSESLPLDGLTAERLVAEVQRICEGVERFLQPLEQGAQP